ncbi:hypothetical protein PTQ47_02890, partial [Klebsiella michiganensis]|uniref:hypothetical protein n=1 Tax=Klebsiella michiganensis TaxID=1134687 RepID=UPI00287E745A
DSTISRSQNSMPVFFHPPITGDSSAHWRGSRYIQIVASHRCHRGAALPSMNGLSKLLGENQL